MSSGRACPPRLQELLSLLGPPVVLGPEVVLAGQGLLGREVVLGAQGDLGAQGLLGLELAVRRVVVRRVLLEVGAVVVGRPRRGCVLR